MVDLVFTPNHLLVLALAGGGGALGGLLTKAVGETSGAQQGVPGSPKPVGPWPRALVGAGAAVIFLALDPPDTQVTLVGGTPRVSQHYDVIPLLAFSVLVGTAGRAFITAAQQRALALVNQTRADSTADAAQTRADSTADAAQEQIRQVADSAQRTALDKAALNVGEELPRMQAQRRESGQAASDEVATLLREVREVITQQTAQPARESIESEVKAAQQVVQRVARPEQRDR